MQNEIVSIKNLKISFINNGHRLQVVRSVNTKIKKAKITGILGESGSGKTVSFSSLIKLLPSSTGKIDSGEILFKGRDILSMNERELQDFRGKSISYIFQNPAQALNPYKTVGRQLQEKLKIHGLKQTRPLILNTLRDVGLDDPELIYDMYPFQLSGGLSQRVLIASSIILNPELLIADEPTSAVDSSLKKKILELFRMINSKLQMSIIIITHDFDIVEYLCHHVIIMYGGLILEEGSVEEILHNPQHPYTKELIRCTQSLGSGENRLYSLPGTPLSPHDFENCCPFYERCSLRIDACLEGIPDMKCKGEHKVRCILFNESEEREDKDD